MFAFPIKTDSNVSFIGLVETFPKSEQTGSSHPLLQFGTMNYSWLTTMIQQINCFCFLESTVLFFPPQNFKDEHHCKNQTLLSLSLFLIAKVLWQKVKRTQYVVVTDQKQYSAEWGTWDAMPVQQTYNSCAKVRLTYKRYILHINKMSMIKNPQPIFKIFFFWRQVHVSCGISCQVSAQIYCGSDHININFPSCIFSTCAAEVIIWTIQHGKAKRNDTILIRSTDLLKVGE